MNEKTSTFLDDVPSPIEDMIRCQNAIRETLSVPANVIRSFESVRATIERMNVADKFFRDLAKPWSIYDEVQESMKWFERVKEQMNTTTKVQQHIDSMKAFGEQFITIADTVGSVFEAIEKQNATIRALMIRPELENVFSKLARQAEEAMSPFDTGVNFERCIKLAAQIESVAPAILADLAPEDIPSEEKTKVLEEECKQVVDILMAADGDYFQILGNLTEPGSKLGKAVRVLAVIWVLWQFCMYLSSGYNWLSKFWGKKSIAGFVRSRALNNCFVVTPFRLNVRAKPDMKGQKIGVLTKGQMVRVLFKNRYWANIVIDGPAQGNKITGFVWGKYLKPAKQKTRVQIRRREETPVDNADK